MHAEASTFAQLACPACLRPNRLPSERLGENPKCGQCGTALMDGKPVELEGAAFEAFIARTDVPVLVDFWAAWCGPCRAMAPAFTGAAADLRGEARLIKVNVDIAQSQAARLGIRSIPTLVLFRAGKERARVSGARDAASLVDWVRRNV